MRTENVLPISKESRMNLFHCRFFMTNKIREEKQ